MKYSLNTRQTGFNTKGILTYFQQLREACAKHNTDFLVVGAFARDLLQQQIFGADPGIQTKDVDVGILLPDWPTYQLIIKELTDRSGFTRGGLVHEFYSAGNIQTDLLPFGGIERERSISFPETPQYGMNMMGFAEAWATRLTVVLDGSIEISIPSAPGIIMLKLIAWGDRRPQDVALKHIVDIANLVDAFYFGSLNEMLDDPANADVADVVGEGAPLFLQSAVVIGRQMKSMTDKYPETRQKLVELLNLHLEEDLSTGTMTFLARTLATDLASAERTILLMRNELTR